MGDAAISLKGVSKRFRRDSAGVHWKRLLSRLKLRATRKQTVSSGNSFDALRDISFEVGRGEALGIMGPNGAGKSTLLKLLAGILRADSGLLQVCGRVSSLIELGAGFHGDLTGRENIYLNGTILGMRRREIHSKLDSIVDFAGIAEFLDVPVKRYSSGMHARLGFAIAAHTNPDVLLVDEVLSVGDAVYRLRCLARMRELVQQGATLVLVSHDLEQIREGCPRSILLEQGRLVYDGSSEQTSRMYMQSVSRSICHRPADLECTNGPRGLTVIQFQHCDEFGKPVSTVRPTQSFAIELQLGGAHGGTQLVMELNLRGLQCGQIVSLNSARDGFTCTKTDLYNPIIVRLKALPISAGDYFWNVRVWDSPSGRLLLDTPFQYPLQIHSAAPSSGNAYCEREWSSGAESLNLEDLPTRSNHSFHQENANAHLPVG